MFTHLREIKPNRIAPGVEEKVLLSPANTSYGKMTVRLLTFEPGARAIAGRIDQESICFVVDGKGVASVKWLRGYWKYLLRSDVALLVPSLGHEIRNSGDSTLRCLLTSCRTEPRTDDRDVSIRTFDVRIPPSNSVAHRTYGSEIRIFLSDVLGARSKFGYCGYGTLYSGGATEMHIPTGECEETMYVTNGEGAITTDKDIHVVTAGSLAHIPKGTFHNEKSTGEEPLEYVVFESHD